MDWSWQFLKILGDIRHWSGFNTILSKKNLGFSFFSVFAGCEKVRENEEREIEWGQRKWWEIKLEERKWWEIKWETRWCDRKWGEKKWWKRKERGSNKRKSYVRESDV